MNLYLIITVISFVLVVFIIIGLIFFSKKKKPKRDKKLTKKQKDKIEKTRAEKIKTTLDWIDIQKISHQGIELERNNKKMIVKGVKLDPINITIQKDSDIVGLISSLSNSLDKMKFNVYWKFVKIPPSISYQHAILSQRRKREENRNIAKLLDIQMRKLDFFRDNFQEIVFYALVQDDELHIDKTFSQLQQGLAASFNLSSMTCKDYENLVGQAFENDVVNEYMFTQLLLPKGYETSIQDKKTTNLNINNKKKGVD